MSTADLLEAWPPSRLQEVMDEALIRWNVEDLRAAIGVCWNPRLRTTIGRALLDDMVVELNPTLLARYPEEVRPVLLHEAAHLVVRRLFGPSTPPHGKFWKAYMRSVGVSTRATHNLDVSGLRRPRRRKGWRLVKQLLHR